MTGIYCWAVSPEGSAVATWLSSLVGVAAILIAVAAFLNDRRRAAEDRKRTETERAETLRNFIAGCLDAIALINDDVAVIEAGATAVASTDHLGSYALAQGRALGLRIEPAFTVLDTLRRASPPDAGIAVPLAKATIVVRRYVEQELFAGTAASHFAGQLGTIRTTLDQQAALLRLQRDRHMVGHASQPKLQNKR